MINNLTVLRKILNKQQKISLIVHRNPDGDAIGSSLALQKFLRKFDHEVTVISPNEIPQYLQWMPGVKDIVIFSNNRSNVKELLWQSKLIFTLDFNDFSRTGKDFEDLLLTLSDKNFVMIDHHLEPSNYAKFMFSDSHKSSTSEMVFDFIIGLDGKHRIDKEIATNLYTGIMTDTGSFKFPNTTAHTMRIVADLFDYGINHSQIQVRIYDSFTVDRLHLLGEALNKLVFLPEYKTAYIAMSQADLKKFNFQKGDTEGFVNYGLSIADSNFAVMFIENEEEGIRISFRSKGKFPANEFAKKYFNGGGHLNAAGGRTNMSLQQTLDLFLEKLPEFKEKLIKANE